MLTFLVLVSLSAVQPSNDPFNTDEPAPAPQQTTASQVAAPAPAAAPSRQRLICKSRPRLGTRLAYERRCLTAEQWTVYEADMEQSRRDIADRGARGCDMATSPEC